MSDIDFSCCIMLWRLATRLVQVKVCCYLTLQQATTRRKNRLSRRSSVRVTKASAIDKCDANQSQLYAELVVCLRIALHWTYICDHWVICWCSSWLEALTWIQPWHNYDTLAFVYYCWVYTVAYGTGLRGSGWQWGLSTQRTAEIKHLIMGLTGVQFFPASEYHILAITHRWLQY